MLLCTTVPHKALVLFHSAGHHSSMHNTHWVVVVLNRCLALSSFHYIPFSGQDADLPHTPHKPVQMQSSHICQGRLSRILLRHFARCPHPALCTTLPSIHTLLMQHLQISVNHFVILFQLLLQLLPRTPCYSWPMEQLKGWCPVWPR